MQQIEYLCCASGCPGNHARSYPLICLMAEGYKRGDHDPVRVTIFSPTCRMCRNRVKVADFLGPELRAQVLGQLRQDGKAPADFDSAWLEWGVIGDRVWWHMLERTRESLQ